MADSTQGKPNVVLILMDNLGYGELGCYGGGILRGAPTPRIDKLATEGFRLLNFNVEAQCTPSRAALMTERYAIRTGNGSVPIHTPLYGLVQAEYTMAKMLAEVGYATGCFGKWHLGHTQGRYPTDQGFDEWYGIPNSTDESTWPGHPMYRPDSDPFAAPEYVMEGTKSQGPKKLKIYDLSVRPVIDRELTDRAKEFITRQAKAEKPFFAYIPYTMPHFPVRPAPEFDGKTGNGFWADAYLAGHVMQQEHWTHLNLPAIADSEQQIQIGNDEFHQRWVGDPLHEEREPREVLEKMKSNVGSFNFSAQYQQCPVPLEGEIIKWGWFKFVDACPARVPNDRIIQSWDTASKAKELSDYSVCTTWLQQGNRYYLLDLLREKLEYPNLRRRVLDHAVKHNANAVLIEDKGSGTSLIQDFKHANTYGIPDPIGILPEHDKVTRMSNQSAKIEAGQIYLPKQAAWLGDLQAELLQFPYGAHDDQVDSISQFLNWIERKRGNGWCIQERPF